MGSANRVHGDYNPAVLSKKFLDQTTNLNTLRSQRLCGENQLLEKGKPSERMGRKATGPPEADGRAAGRVVRWRSIKRGGRMRHLC